MNNRCKDLHRQHAFSRRELAFTIAHRVSQGCDTWTPHVWLKLGLSARHVIIWLGNLQGPGMRFWRSAFESFSHDVGRIHLFDRVLDSHDE
jgi:hypothetical protein